MPDFSAYRIIVLEISENINVMGPSMTLYHEYFNININKLYLKAPQHSKSLYKEEIKTKLKKLYIKKINKMNSE